MKKGLLLSVLMVMMSLTTNAYDAEIDGIYYNFSGDEAEVTYKVENAYDNYSGDVIIPELVTYRGKEYHVTSIGYKAFSRCTDKVSIAIPKSVNVIKFLAFSGCKGLTSIIIPDGVETIEMHAFDGSVNLVSIVMPENMTSIGSGAFYSCKSLAAISIPQGVEKLLSETFYGCSSLSSVSIPESVKFIDTSAFMSCTSLTNIKFPDSVEGIYERVFENCKNLKSIILSENLKHLGQDAFYGCSNLAEIVCKAQNPPATQYIDKVGLERPGGVFYGVNKQNCKLYVPKGCEEAYRASDLWKDFGNIVALDNPNDTLHNHPKYYQDGDYWVQALVPWDFEERIHDYETAGSGENFSLYFFYVEGDTIIDNKEYKCVHAKTWVYDCEETYNHQPEGLIEGVQVSNLLFMREDADGKQWRRLSYLTDEALLFDFSHPFEKGQVIRFCKHDHLSDVLENVCYESVQTKAYSNSSRLNKALRSDDKAPEGYLYYNLEVSNVTTLELPNGEQVPFANGRIAFGWGDVYQGDLFHQFVPVCESFSGRFLYRVHQGQVVLQKQDNINRISSIIGTDVLSLFNKPKDTNKYFSKDQMATIILPSAPDASKGKYYGLDRCEEGKIIFTEELQPKARVPYIIVPKEDFTIDLSNLELESLLSDTVSVKGAYFIGSYNSAELNCQEGFYIDIIDSTPDCHIIGTDQRKAAIGALRAFLVAPWDDPYTQGPTKGIKNKREIVLQDDPNGIYEMKSERVKSEKYNDAVYDLSGRKMFNVQSSMFNGLKTGLYIQNGRKVSVK